MSFDEFGLQMGNAYWSVCEKVLRKNQKNVKKNKSRN